MLHVPPEVVKDAPRTWSGWKRRLKELGAVPMTPEMKRRLIAAGEWGMPKE